MRREEFLKQLEQLLMDIPESDRLDAIAYYSNYFDEAGPENEERIIRELGSPERVAQTIKGDLGYEEPRGYEEPKGYEEPRSYEEPRGYGSTGTYQTEPKKKFPWVAVVIIAVLTFPLWIGIVAGLFGVCVGLIGAFFGVVFGLLGAGFGLLVGGIVCFVAGLLHIAVNPLEGLVSVGVGAILQSVALLILLLLIWLAFRWLPALCKAVVKGCKGLFHHKEGGNEI